MVVGSKIHFFFNTPVALSERTRLKSFIERIFRKEGKSLENLNYVFCTDKELLRLNQEYLGHDYYTDILSFDLTETRARLISGEIYISVPRVRENAKLLRILFKQELLRVIFHGALHFCGYDDKTPAEIRKMRKKEEEYLSIFLK